ncbi:MAG: hypothetical protein U1F58_18265 [Burkholderiales bacterium]
MPAGKTAMSFATPHARPALVLAVLAALLASPHASIGGDVGGDDEASAAAGQPEHRSAALRASAAHMTATDLAKQYNRLSGVLAQLAFADAGANLMLPEGRITRENVAAARADYRTRLWVYGEVIRERGFRDVHGGYRASVGPACARAQSAWIFASTHSDVREVELRQDGFVVRIELHDQAGAVVGFGTTAVIVESSLAFTDPVNTAYPLVGVVDGDTITVRPDADAVLRGWPAWADPPSREALAACVVTLAKGDGEPGGAEPTRPAEAATAPTARLPSTPAVAAGPSASELAKEYADVAARRKTAASLLSGEIVRLPEKPDAKQEYEREKQTLDAREGELGAAIRVRGFANLVGRYRATAPAACKEVSSPWAAAVSDGTIREVEVSQEGFVVTVAGRRPHGSAVGAIVVESTLVVANPMGTGYPFSGEVGGDAIRLRPDLDPMARRSSARVARMPTAQALADCVVTLTRTP